MKFSEKLENLRKSKGMSQEDLAQKLNVTRQTVSKWELDQTAPDMNKLIEISKLFEISLDELANNIETSNSEKTYKESSVEKNNKKIAIRIFIVGLIISLLLCGIGLIKQNDAKKINEQRYNEAYDLSVKNYNNAMDRVDQINVELKNFNSKKDTLEAKMNSLKMASSNWFSETTKLTNEIYELDIKIMNLEGEKNQLLSADYKVYYELVKPITYNIFYYIAAGIFIILTLIALIYYLVTRKK